jgi:hypothetical protein
LPTYLLAVSRGLQLAVDDDRTLEQILEALPQERAGWTVVGGTIVHSSNIDAISPLVEKPSIERAPGALADALRAPALASLSIAATPFLSLVA